MSELSINVSAEYEDSVGVTTDFDVANLLKTLTTKACFKLKQTVADTPAAINIGSISPLGYLFITNVDPNNSVTVMTGVGSDECTILEPGDVMCNPCGDDMQAPYAFAEAAGTYILVCAFAR